MKRINSALLLLVLLASACGTSNESSLDTVQETTLQEETAPTTSVGGAQTTVAGTTTSTTEAEDLEPASTTPTTTVTTAQETTTTQVWIDPWPEIGEPVRVVVHTNDGWPTIDAPVYQHIPEQDENGNLARDENGQVELVPMDYHAANWVARGFSNPGQEGFSLLPGHQGQIFKPLANGGVPEGTLVEIYDTLGNVIRYHTRTEPEEMPKEGLPWERIAHSEQGESLVTLVTCGDRDNPIYQDGPYAGHSLVNFFVTAEMFEIEYTDTNGERQTFTP